MKSFALPAVAVLLGLGLGIGSTWSQFLLDTDYFTPARKVEVRDKSGLAPVAADGQAKVVVLNGEEFNFGAMDRNTTDSHTFKFKNVGNAPLQLEEGDSTCKCTISKLANNFLQPGETVNVTLEWTPRSDAENFSQSAEIRTSDPDRQIVALRIVGRVIETVRANPPDVVFTSISANETTTAQVQVFAYAHESLKLIDYELTNARTADFFEIDAEPMPADEVAKQAGAKSGLLLTVSVKPGMHTGPIVNQKVRLITNAQPTGGVEIPIKGKILADISFSGRPDFYAAKELLDLGLIAKGKEFKTIMSIFVIGPNRHDVELTIDEANIDPAGVLQVAIGEPSDIANGNVRMFPLTIRIPRGSRAVARYGPDRANLGKIFIRTTHPTLKKIPLYVRFAVEG